MRPWIVVLSGAVALCISGCVANAPETEPAEELGTAVEEWIVWGPGPHGVVGDPPQGDDQQIDDAVVPEALVAEVAR